MFNIENAAYCGYCQSLPTGGLLQQPAADRCLPMSVVVARGCAAPYREACVVDEGGFARAFRSLDFNAMEDYAAGGFNGRAYSLPMHVVHPTPFALYKNKQ